MTRILKAIFHQTRRTIARLWLKLHPNVVIIGVTGSYGKTSTVQAIAKALGGQLKTITTDINLDTIYNLPITLLKINHQTQVLILEYGIDHQGEMDKHLQLVKPDIAVLTGITPVHSEADLLGSLENIMREKSKLIGAADNGKIFINGDDPYNKKIAAKLTKKFFTYGTDKKANFRADNIQLNKQGLSLTAHFNHQKREITTKLLGKHFNQEIMAAIAIASLLKINLDQVIQNLNELTPLKGRMSLERGPKNSLLINDSLRASPQSTIAGLKTLSDIPHQGQKIAVLGEMGELGQYQDQEHYRIGKIIPKLNIDYLVTIGPATKMIIRGAVENGFPQNNAFETKNVHQAVTCFNKLLDSKTLWYLKGSLLKHLERILMILRGEKVACRRVSCHNYYHCSQCPLLTKHKTQNTKFKNKI